MSEQVILNKRVYSKEQYPKVIDTSFKQLVPTTTVPVESTITLPDVNQFFNYYEALFYSIPKEGATNSHQYLIERSEAYLGNTGVSEEIQALLQEITQLRSENLQLLEEVNKLTTTNE